MKIKKVELFDGSITVSHNKKVEDILSHVVCERLLVEKL